MFQALFKTMILQRHVLYAERILHILFHLITLRSLDLKKIRLFQIIRTKWVESLVNILQNLENVLLPMLAFTGMLILMDQGVFWVLLAKKSQDIFLELDI